MTRAEIIKLIREAGIRMGGHPMNPLNAYVEDLERFAALVAAGEREAICPIVYGHCGSDNDAQRIVDAIRARSAK